MIGSLIDATGEVYEEIVEKIVLSNGSITLEKVLKGFGPFGIVDLIYLGKHVFELNLEQIVGDFGSVIGNYVGEIGGGLGGAAVTPAGTVPGAYAGGAYGSIKGEELFEYLYRESKAALHNTKQYIYDILKAEFNESSIEYFKDLEEFSKLKDDYMKNYDMTKLNEFNEKILSILERDDYCDPIK